MFETTLLRERLENVLLVLERIRRRFKEITYVEDFSNSDDGIDILDAICMNLIAVGESFRYIDRRTEGKLLANYPEIDWSGVIGVRDVIAHGYFDVDPEEIYNICQSDIPKLITVVKKMLNFLPDKDSPSDTLT